MNCAMKSWIVLNINGLFNPNSFNRGIDPQSPVGTFEFDLDPFVERTSATMGVRERHFTTRLRQTGNFVDSPHVLRAFQDGLRRAVDRVLTTTPNLPDQDRLYFTLSSNRLTSNFQGWGLRAGEWREGGVQLDALFKPSTAMNNSKWPIRSNCLSLKSIIPLREPEHHAVPNQVIKISKT